MANGLRLAAFDWPRPPSPARADCLRPATVPASFRERSSLVLGLGSSNTLGTLRAETDKEWMKAAWRPVETRAKAVLWAKRADIDKEKLRIVAPYPFFGCQMRFQDDHGALQISFDGRFSFSDACLEALANADAEEDSEKKIERKQKKRVITYEGVFTGNLLPSQEEDENQGTSKDNKEQPSEKVGPEVAAIEGLALVRYEIEDSGDQPRLVTVEPGTFRFIITISPFFQPTQASVKPLLGPRSPGRPPPRTRRMPYIGSGEPGKKSSVQKRTIGKRRVPPTTTKSTGFAESVLLPSSNTALKEVPGSTVRSAFQDDLGSLRGPLSAHLRPRSRLSQSSSVPYFPTQRARQSGNPHHRRLRDCLEGDLLARR